MNAYRLIAMGMTTCAASLPLAACSAGITTASPPASRSPATSRTAPSPTSAASHPTSPSASPSPADTISVDAPIGSFPIPHGAQVLSNMTCDKQVMIGLSSVTPSKASSFYVSELPRAGYQITSNIGGTAPGVTGSITEIDFTGHGYQGLIIAASDLGALPSTGPSPASLPSSITKNFAEISLTPPGTTGTGCAG
jgi:hypothetical protein